jgi:hypothetical protein
MVTHMPPNVLLCERKEGTNVAIPDPADAGLNPDYKG